MRDPRVFNLIRIHEGPIGLHLFDTLVISLDLGQVDPVVAIFLLIAQRLLLGRVVERPQGHLRHLEVGVDLWPPRLFHGGLKGEKFG